jgi:hypothetical protein
MSLNKEICKKCINNGRTREVLGEPLLVRAAWQWNDLDENWWKDGRVVCPGNRQTYVDNDGIPTWCKYRLEHILEQGSV